MGVRLVEDNDLIAVADAIREKTNKSDSLIFPDEFVTAIEDITTGESDDFEWINDGNTHIWISLQEGRTSPMMGVHVNGTVTIDWGDGTTPDVITGDSLDTTEWTPVHHYASAGDYIITLISDGEMVWRDSDADETPTILRYSEYEEPVNQVYANSVIRVELGQCVTSIGDYAFYYCSSLLCVLIPNSVTSIGENAFFSCCALRSVVIPDSVTSIGENAFQYCDALLNMVIPDSVTSIERCTFGACKSLSNIVIPDSVTSIGENAFYDCYSVAFYDFSNHTNVPTLSNTDVFDNIPSDCQIRVPAALYDEWISATNWSDLAQYIVAV